MLLCEELIIMAESSPHITMQLMKTFYCSLGALTGVNLLRQARVDWRLFFYFF